MASSHYNVAIVGGGASGMAAASKLYKEGIRNIILLEAQSRLGGRIYSVLHERGHLEFGAHWVHGEEGNAVYDIASKKDLLDEELTYLQTGLGDTLHVRADGEVVSEDVIEDFRSFAFELEGETKTLKGYKDSIGKFCSDRFLENNKWGDLGHELMGWHSRFMSLLNGADSWYDSSGHNETIYKECPGNTILNWRDGYHTLIDHFKSSLSEDVINLNSPVVRVHWKTTKCSEPSVELLLSSGKMIHADHVILTPSLAVLKNLAQDIFYPPLPSSKMAAIQGLGIGVVDKIYIKFPFKFWDDKGIGFTFLKHSYNAIFTEENWEDAILGFYEVYKNPNIMCGWITGRAAMFMEATPIEEVKDRCYHLLKKYLKNVCAVPDILWCTRSQWGSNPWIRGSYSYRSIDSEMMDVQARDLAQPILDPMGSPILCFAGEATHDCYYSTVHGAVESGWREAARIIDYTRTNPSYHVYNQCEHFEVAIIGAGAAGLQAAQEFLNKGVDSVIILEASDRIGGRVYSYSTSNGIVDLGAQWIHGEVRNMLYDIGASHQLIHEILSLDGEGDFLTEKGEKISEDVLKEFFKVMRDINDEFFYTEQNIEGNSSIGHFFQRKFYNYLKNTCRHDSNREKHLKECLYHWMMRWERIDNACDSLHQLSAKQYKDFIYCEGKDNMNPKHGMSSLLLNLVGERRRPIIRNNSEVVRISRQEELICLDGKWYDEDGRPPVVVTCRNGLKIECHHVVVTCPLGYLKKHKDLFAQPLPETLQKAIGNIGYGTLNKIFLEFDSKWWKPDNVGIQLVWSEKIPDFNRTQHHPKMLSAADEKMRNYWYYAICGFDPMFDGRPILCGWIGGPEAEFMEELSDKEVSDTCISLLKKFTGNPALPDPINIYRSKWASDPFICGTYSHRTVQTEVEGVLATDLNIPVYGTDSSRTKVPLLVLAGEANSLHYYSTVHGAMENGASQSQHYLSLKQRHSSGGLRSKL